MTYKCRLGERKDDAQLIEVSIRQEYEVLENAALEVVSDVKDAERRVKTVLTGNGIVMFDTKRGVVMKAEMINDATSDVTSLADGKKSQRKLKTNFSLSMKPPAKPSQNKPEGWFSAAWSRVASSAQSLWESTLGWWTVAKLTFLKKFGTGG
jgi:hypothetical protein